MMRKKNKKPSASSMITNPSRKSRTKTRKPKYLSLRLQISPDKTPSASASAAGDGDRRHQLNLFPLHPENLMDEKDAHDENMAYLFSAVDGGGATTLTALLGPGGGSSSAESLTYAYGGQDNSEEVEQKMVRAAMRNKAREPSEEKWVSCCSVGSGSGIRVKEEEVEERVRRKRLLLKLDYEVVMNAWSDKGPLFHVDSSSQVVPDLNDDDFFNQPASTHDWGGNGGLWKVPEMSGSKSKDATCIKVEGVQVGGEEYKIGRREASVLRYKEKRQNRLFAKKIRYEVRKLNAEKRPRVKGRFVKKA